MNLNQNLLGPTGADAYRQYAQGFVAPMEIELERRTKRARNWKTA